MLYKDFLTTMWVGTLVEITIIISICARHWKIITNSIKVGLATLIVISLSILIYCTAMYLQAINEM